jgi:predicted nuclease with RNAse H fold
MTLTNLTFDVPGASVALDGTYALRAETLDFRGVLRLDAKLSQTATGFKSILLRAVDPLFRRRGSSVLPIKVTGTIEDPSFGLDSRRLLSPAGGRQPRP